VIKYATLLVVTAMVAGIYEVSASKQTSHDRARVDDLLYQANCAGCHGADGRGGAARGLIDPAFLEIADEATMRRVTGAGVPGTAMPAFAIEAGGTLTDQQIGTMLRSLRAAGTAAGVTRDTTMPPYSTSLVADPERGGEAFAMFCGRCHGADGRGGQGFQGSSIVDASYLALVSDQSLRTTVIAGRPDLGSPDWRGNVAGRPMSPREVSDVVAWLAAQRGITQ
jgi:cytochrome c oxidase cbb3-type subunit III